MFHSTKRVLFAINCLIAVVLLDVAVVVVDSNRMFNKMYHQVPNTKLSYCNKYLNKTSVIGCDGPLIPSSGLLLPNVTIGTIAYLEKFYSSYHNFVPILSASDPDLKPILRRLAELKAKVVGILVINRANRNDRPGDNLVRSDDVSCPNQRMTTDTTVNSKSDCATKWINSSQDQIGSFFAHWPFQIFYIEDTDTIDQIDNCTQTWNSDLFLMDKNNRTTFRGDNYFALKPFCAAELYNPTYAPNADHNPELCLNRKDRIITLKKTKYCSQIILKNILVPITPMFESVNYGKKSIIIVAVRMDSLTLFSGKSPGADSMYTALIASISIAHTMARYQAQFQNQSVDNVAKHPVIFAFYGGESMYYIGSSYHAFTLNENQGHEPEEETSSEAHPSNNPESHNNSSSSYKEEWIRSGMDKLKLDQIGFVMELNQLASHINSHYGQSKFWIYSSSNSKNRSNNSLGQTILNSMRNHLSPEVGIELVDESVHGIPPSSVHSFMAYNNNPQNEGSKDIDIEAAVITNHLGPFTNHFYHSVFDTLANVANFSWAVPANESDIPYKEYDTRYLSVHLGRLVNLISKSLIEASFGSDFTTLQLNQTTADLVDVEFIDQLVNCIFIDNNCSLFHRIRPHSPGYYNRTNFQNTDLTSNQIVNDLVYDLMRTVTGQNVTCPQPEEVDNPYIQAFFYYLYEENQSTESSNSTTNTTIGQQQNQTEVYQCLRHQVFNRPSTSPHFLQNADQWIRDWSSQWVVSHKRKKSAAPRLRIFLQQSMAFEYTMYALGLIWVVVPVVTIKLCL